jgi:ElaB/YqjD/DUF883 family membrane-anchored ribosome-binding protein
MTDVTGGPVPGPETDDMRNRLTGAGGQDAESRTFRGMAEAAAPKVRRAADTADMAVAQGDSLLAAGLDTAQAKAEQARIWAAAQRDVARERVIAHPFTSVGATFVAGLIVGLLLARR